MPATAPSLPTSATFERERPGPQQHRGDGDRRVTAAPVVAAASEQANGRTLPAHLQAIAVVLNLVDPPGPAGGFMARVGMQGGM
jgi:hypothetical protein